MRKNYTLSCPFKFNFKFIIFTTSFFLTHTFINAQNLYSSVKYQISFFSTEFLERYETTTDYGSTLGYDNDNCAVEIEIVPYNELSETYKSDPKYAALEVAELMEITNLNAGEALKKTNHSFYYLGSVMEDGLAIPVYVVAILVPNREVAYEITIYCYDGNKNNGYEIAHSIQIKE